MYTNTTFDKVLRKNNKIREIRNHVLTEIGVLNMN